MTIKQHETRKVAISDLTPADYNPRDMTKRERSALEASLIKFGLVETITWNERSGNVVGGHQRLDALIKHGAEFTTVVVVDLDATDEMALNIVLNSPHNAGHFVNLDVVLKQVQVELQPMEFEALDLALLLPEPEPAPAAPSSSGGSGDEIPEEVPAITQLGDRVEIGRHLLICGDCIEEMRKMPDNSVDAVICDPPYGLSPDGKARTWDDLEELRAKGKGPKGGFMGKDWDSGVPGITWSREVLRVLKPGGHLVAASSTRTYHRLACSAEDAGFEIRDMIDWLHWQGFPKGINVSKAIDRQRNDDPRPVCRWIRATMEAKGLTSKTLAAEFEVHSRMIDHWAARDTDSQPETPKPEAWAQLRELLGGAPDEIEALVEELNGRKGLLGDDWEAREVTGQHVGPAAAQTWTGNVLGTEVGVAKEQRDNPTSEGAVRWKGWGTQLKPAKEPFLLARKPLEGGMTVADNVLKWGTGALNIDAARIPYGDDAWPGPGKLIETRPASPSGAGSGVGSEVYGYRPGVEYTGHEDGGWPANIFHAKKPARKEKEGGCEGLPQMETASLAGGENPNDPVSERFRSLPKGNIHPTVKPVKLMRWLLTLLTPPGGTVLEPFAGSGTTLVAAGDLDCSVIAIELDPHYCDIVRARTKHLV